VGDCLLFCLILKGVTQHTRLDLFDEVNVSGQSIPEFGWDAARVLKDVVVINDTNIVLIIVTSQFPPGLLPPKIPTRWFSWKDLLPCRARLRRYLVIEQNVAKIPFHEAIGNLIPTAQNFGQDNTLKIVLWKVSEIGRTFWLKTTATPKVSDPFSPPCSIVQWDRCRCPTKNVPLLGFWVILYPLFGHNWEFA